MEKLQINHEKENVWEAFGMTDSKLEAMTNYLVQNTDMNTGRLKIGPMSNAIEKLVYMFANNMTEAIGIALFFQDFRIMPDHIIEKYTNLKRHDRGDFDTLSKLADFAIKHAGIDSMPDQVRRGIIDHLDDPKIDCDKCPGKEMDCGILKLGKAIGHEKAKKVQN